MPYWVTLDQRTEIDAFSARGFSEPRFATAFVAWHFGLSSSVISTSDPHFFVGLGSQTPSTLFDQCLAKCANLPEAFGQIGFAFDNVTVYAKGGLSSHFNSLSNAFQITVPQQWYWGGGINWNISERYSLNLRYERHELTGVQTYAPILPSSDARVQLTFSIAAANDDAQKPPATPVQKPDLPRPGFEGKGWGRPPR